MKEIDRPGSCTLRCWRRRGETKGRGEEEGGGVFAGVGAPEEGVGEVGEREEGTGSGRDEEEGMVSVAYGGIGATEMRR